MSPALVQALERLVVIAVVGALTAVGANLTILNGDLPNAAYLIPVITAVIDALLKYLGGATVPADSTAFSVALGHGPSWWSA